MPFMTDMAFFAFKISDNILETPEGFLIARNVPIARTGVQNYYGHEMGKIEGREQMYTVYRLPEEVFAPEAMASAEGKPVVNDHPPSGVDLTNVATYSMGHMQNIRRDGDYLIADLVVTDQHLIHLIKSGKREVSAGYKADYKPHKDGYKQVNIRINHLAVVNRGRAGPRVAIKDSKPVISNKGVKPMDRSQIMAAMFKAYAQDASPEEIAQALVVLDEAPAADKKSEKSEGNNGLLATLLPFLMKDNKPEASKEQPVLDALTQQVSKLEKTVSALVKDAKVKDEGSESAAELVESLLADADEEEEAELNKDEDSEESKEKETEDEELEESETKDEAAFASFVKALKPTIAKLPPKSRKMVTDALVQQVGRTSTKNDYAAIQKNKAEHGKQFQDAAPKQDLTKLGDAIAKAHNPHYKEQKKLSY